MHALLFIVLRRFQHNKRGITMLTLFKSFITFCVAIQMSKDETSNNFLTRNKHSSGNNNNNNNNNNNK